MRQDWAGKDARTQETGKEENKRKNLIFHLRNAQEYSNVKNYNP